MVKLIGTVKKEEVPTRNGGSGPNPELVPIIDAVVQNLDTGDFVKLEVADKKEGERTRESVRNLLKARGYNVTCASDAKMVNVRHKDGTKEPKLKHYVYVAAFTKVVAPEPEPVKIKVPRRKPTKEKEEVLEPVAAE